MDDKLYMPTESVSAVQHKFEVLVDPTVCLHDYSAGLYDRMAEVAPRTLDRSGIDTESLIQYLDFIVFCQVQMTKNQVRGMGELQFLQVPALLKNRLSTLGNYRMIKPDFSFVPVMKKVDFTSDQAFEMSERLSNMRNVIEIDDHAFNTSSRTGEAETMTKCLRNGHITSITDAPGDSELNAVLFGLTYNSDDWWINRYEYAQSDVSRIRYSIVTRDGYYGLLR